MADNKEPLLMLSAERNIIDFEGPPLVLGAKNWMIFYHLIAQFNWPNTPLYLCLLYKLLITSLSAALVITQILQPFFDLSLISHNYHNPVFLLINGLSVMGACVLMLLSMHVNLLNLGPLYKVLHTRKLCFVSEHVLHSIGTKSMFPVLLFHIYNGVMVCMVSSQSLEDFVQNFSLPLVLAKMIATIVMLHTLLGTVPIDLYVRTAFAYWLIGLTYHMKRQFTYLHRRQRQQIREQKRTRNVLALNGASSGGLSQTVCDANLLKLDDANCATAVARGNGIGGDGGTSKGGADDDDEDEEMPQIFLTFDEVQRSLNNMDDHLEALRNVQVGPLTMLTLVSFLGNGALIMTTYHLVVNQANYYHGGLMLLIAINTLLVVISLCYLGDRFLFYALSKFVQCVEDEYFMQKDMRDILPRASDNSAASSANDSARTQQQQQQQQQQQPNNEPCDCRELLIKKRDVLFCREFLHQFENHLATPWSNLTFTSHLHMLRAFVTLLAGQIIFDYEH